MWKKFTDLWILSSQQPPPKTCDITSSMPKIKLYCGSCAFHTEGANTFLLLEYVYACKFVEWVGDSYYSIQTYLKPEQLITTTSMGKVPFKFCISLLSCTLTSALCTITQQELPSYMACSNIPTELCHKYDISYIELTSNLCSNQ